MNLSHLFLSFDGRINRKPFWIGALLLGFSMVIVTFVLVFLLGFLGAPLVLLAILPIIIWLAFLYFSVALGVKRFHDRGKSGWLMAVVVVPGMLTQIGDLTGLTTTEQMVGPELMNTPNALGWVLLAISLVVAIWALIELGIRKGTEGSNEYGPDPLASQAGRPQLA